jgi:hypothetical protein
MVVIDETNERKLLMLRIGVIGGTRGLVIADLLEFLANPADIIGVADNNSAILERWAVRWPNVVRYQDPIALMRNPAVDAVYIATPVDLHYQQSVDALSLGKHVLCEVPACTTVKQGIDLLKLVRSSALTYMMAENYCFIPEVALIQDLCAHQEFGTLVYASCAYIHDCKRLTFDSNDNLTWRGQLRRQVSGNEYPTHAIGPVANWLRTASNGCDSLKTITSFGSRSVALRDYVAARYGEDHPYAAVEFFQKSDRSFSFIKTQQGVTIDLMLDLYSNRPPGMAGYMLQGSKGSYQSGRHDDEEGILWLESFGQEDDQRKYFPCSALHSSPTLQSQKEMKLGRRFPTCLMFDEFVASVTEQRQPLISIADAVLWSSIIPLSKESVVKGNANISFPEEILIN